MSRSAKRPELLRQLSSITFLRALPPEEVQSLIPLLEPFHFPAGTRLMRKGDPGDSLLLLKKGTVSVNLENGSDPIPVKEGSVLGEMSLLNGAPRTATITSETAVSGWKLAKTGFESILEHSPGLRKSLDSLSEDRKKGIRPVLPESQIWISTALRAVEAQAKGIKVWQLLTGIGILLWALSLVNRWFPVVNPAEHELAYAIWMLLAGLLTLQGSCEGFLIGVERLGARYKWDGFISGTVGSLLSTIPEFVVIAFLVLIDPVAAYVTAMVTIFNNALAFSIYSFFLPKNKEGAFTMPRSMTKAGNEILIAGSAIALISGLLMLVLRAEHISEVLTGPNLILIGLILIMIYGFYLLMLVRYYSEGQDEEGTLPPDPERLGHNTSWTGIGVMFLVGIGGAYIGGESIGAFAETAIKKMGLPTIPTAAALAFFAGISEYIIVFKSHKRGELGIALSNVFGGLTQVMFLLLPFGMIVIGLAGYATGNPVYSVPINVGTILLMLFLYPLFQSLIQYLEQDKTVNNLDAAGMTGIYILLLYFLFTYSN